jgi:hypothetical protein
MRYLQYAMGSPEGLVFQSDVVGITVTLSIVNSWESLSLLGLGGRYAF